MRKKDTRGAPRRGRSDRRLHPQDRNRLAAARLLVRIEDEGAYAQIVSSPGDDVSPKIREYVSGVTRWQRWLDYLIDLYYTGELESVESLLRQVLRIGAYDLHILGAPAHVAVTAGVAVAGNALGHGAGQLANAVLRRVSAERDTAIVPSGEDQVENLGIRWSHPDWLVKRWLERFGEDGAIALMKYNNERPSYCVRANPFATGSAPIQQLLEETKVTGESTVLDDFKSVKRLAPLMQAGLLDSGRVSVQDVAAGMVVRLLDPQPGETVLDACAAPGGKATYAATLMQNRGRVVAVDRNNVRLRLVRRSAGRQGIRILDTVAGEFESMAEPMLPGADRVLVDAPCSGLGVLARRPDLRWRKKEDDIPGLMKLQNKLLDRAASLLSAGGVLVYSTCTIAMEENEKTVERFLSRHDDFLVEPAGQWLPSEFVAQDGFMNTLPHIHGVDGGFAARLRKQ